MRKYRYMIVINRDDKMTMEFVDTREDICKMLGISNSVINNLLSGRIKKKYNFIKIERIYKPDKTDNTVEGRKAKQREANKKFYEKKKFLRDKQMKDEIITTIENYKI